MPVTSVKKQNILALDTVARHISVALYQGKDNHTDSLIKDSPTRQVESLAPMVDDLLKQSDCALSDLDAVLVCNGPGSFTGLRVALSFAKTLAQSLNIPVKSYTQFDIWLAGAREYIALESGRPLCVILDSRRQEPFMALYDISKGTCVMEPQAVTLEQLQRIHNENNPILCGNADDAIGLLDASALNKIKTLTASMQNKAALMLEIYRGNLIQTDAGEAPDAYYLREADVTFPNKKSIKQG